MVVMLQQGLVHNLRVIAVVKFRTTFAVVAEDFQCLTMQCVCVVLRRAGFYGVLTDFVRILRANHCILSELYNSKHRYIFSPRFIHFGSYSICLPLNGLTSWPIFACVCDVATVQCVVCVTVGSYTHMAASSEAASKPACSA